MLPDSMFLCELQLYFACMPCVVVTVLYVYWNEAGGLHSLLCHSSFENILGIVESPFQKGISHVN
jgi:hypothetical protein